MTPHGPFASLIACDCAGDSPIPIKYGNGRFPVVQKSGHCRGCGAPVPPGRKTWCCRKCYKRFEPTMVIRAAKTRDKEVCAHCGYDSRSERKAWIAECHASSIHHDTWLGRSRAKYRKAEYDHIIPFSEGGLTIIENIRTLCCVCHKQRTKEWIRDRVQKCNPTPELPL